MTILRSLEELETNASLYHIHALTQDGIARAETFYKDNWHHSPYAKNPWGSQFLRKQIDKDLKEHNWKIITLVRDPIAREISDFFKLLIGLRVMTTSKKLISKKPRL